LVHVKCGVPADAIPTLKYVRSRYELMIKIKDRDETLSCEIMIRTMYQIQE